MFIIVNYCSQSNLSKKHSYKFYTYFLNSHFPETFHKKQWKKHIKNAECIHYTKCFQNRCIHQSSTILWTKKKHTTPPIYSYIHLFSVLNLLNWSSFLQLRIAVNIFTSNRHLPIEKHFWFLRVGCGLSQEHPHI